jgi:predicted DNA-binding transcriptional regulator YafY
MVDKPEISPVAAAREAAERAGGKDARLRPRRRAPHAASPTYRLFREAIIHRKQVTCHYHGRYRELCPHILGHKHGQETALTYQFAGESASGLPARGEWRCLALSQVAGARLRDGPWHSRAHDKPQSCVDIIDVEVQP